MKKNNRPPSILKLREIETENNSQSSIQVVSLMRWSDGSVNDTFSTKILLTGNGIVSISPYREDVNVILLINGEEIYLDDNDKDRLIKIMEDRKC